MTSECTCTITDEKAWTTYGSAVEPGSQMEADPDCPIHFPLIERPTTVMRGILLPSGFVPTTDWEPIVGPPNRASESTIARDIIMGIIREHSPMHGHGTNAEMMVDLIWKAVTGEVCARVLENAAQEAPETFGGAEQWAWLRERAAQIRQTAN